MLYIQDIFNFYKTPNLLEELSTFLEAVSKKEQALAEQEVANAQQEVLNKAPLKIYIG